MGMQREMPIFQGCAHPTDAADKTLRLCDSEQDAIAVSIALSALPQAELARRIGVSEQLVSAWKSGGRVLTSKHVGLFCAATGSNLIRQYRQLQSLIRQAAGTPRASDRIAAIAAHTQAAAA
jgi:DNA-binding transcriptional regulator YdaS (Cro superfamily)